MNIKTLLLTVIFAATSCLAIDTVYGETVTQRGASGFSLLTNCGWFQESRPCKVVIANGKLYLSMNGEMNEVRKVWAGRWINPVTQVQEEVAHSEFSDPSGGPNGTTIRFDSEDDRANFWEALQVLFGS